MASARFVGVMTGRPNRERPDRRCACYDREHSRSDEDTSREGRRQPTETADKAAEPAGDPPVSIAMPPPCQRRSRSLRSKPCPFPDRVHHRGGARRAIAGRAAADRTGRASRTGRAERTGSQRTAIRRSSSDRAGVERAGADPTASPRRGQRLFQIRPRPDGGTALPLDGARGQRPILCRRDRRSGSTPLINGPMDSDAAIKFVDDREAEARQRFEHFKHEMISRSASLLQARRDSNDV